MRVQSLNHDVARVKVSRDRLRFRYRKNTMNENAGKVVGSDRLGQPPSWEQFDGARGDLIFERTQVSRVTMAVPHGVGERRCTVALPLPVARG